MRTDTSHLVALHESLDREKARLAASRTEKEFAFRTHCIMMKNREIADEFKYLGMNETIDISDEDLLAELMEVQP